MRRGHVPLLAGILALVVIGLATPGRATYTTPRLDGVRDGTYTTLLTGNATNVSSANDGTWFYVHVTHNASITSLAITHGAVAINITTNTTISGVLAARFAANRTMLEVAVPVALHVAAFTLDGVLLFQSATLFPRPPEPEPEPKPRPVSLTELMGQMGWPTLLLLSWAGFGFWHMSKRRIWLVRGENSIKRVELGRWLGEEERKLGGTSYWMHTFKDALTGVRRTYYTDAVNCKDVLYLKSRFNEYNMLYVELPYLRTGTMPLRPDQQFPERVERKTPRARLIKFLYHLLSWVPSVGDSLYRAREFTETKKMVTEIPYLYVTYEEDQLVAVHDVSWQERVLNDETKSEVWLTRTKRMSVDEIAVLQTQDLTRRPGYQVKQSWSQAQRDAHDATLGSIRNVDVRTENVSFVVRSFNSYEEALNDMLTREKLAAKSRYEIDELKWNVADLNERWMASVRDRERLERDSTVRYHAFIDDVNRNRDHYRDSVAHLVGHAAGLRDIGASERTAWDAAIRQAIHDAEQKLRAEEQRGVRSDIERIKKLEREIAEARAELKRATRTDIMPGEVHVAEK